MIPGSGRLPGEGNHNPLQYSGNTGKSHGQRRLVGYSPWDHKGVKYDLHACVLSRFSCFRFFETPRTVVHQVPQSMEFSRQGYWSGLPCPPPGDLLTQGSNPCLMSPALAGRFFTTSATWEALIMTLLESNAHVRCCVSCFLQQTASVT